MIYVGLDYIPISFKSFIGCFLDLFTINPPKMIQESDMNNIIYGYSCRSLFHTTMKYFYKKDMVVVTTPIHHTSFRNIIEKFVKPENIHIIEMNKNYNTIKKLPDVDRCDLLIVSHLFGQDLLMDPDMMEKFKNKHNCLFIEDRVQGGKICKQFSSNLFDISFYSTGMDKRPVALGGGFMFIRKNLSIHKTNIKNIISRYPRETFFNRLFFLLKKIPTYLLYNYKIVHFITLYFIKFLVSINFYFNANSFAEMYRKKNPGFSHDNYLIKPSNYLLKSIKSNFVNHRKIETNYINKFQSYIELFNEDELKYFYPWYHNKPLLTPYHSIYISQKHLEDIRRFLLFFNIVTIKNPTYKTFNHNYPNKNVDEEFNNSILYLPSLANMNNNELKKMHMIIIFLKKYLTTITKNNG